MLTRINYSINDVKLNSDEKLDNVEIDNEIDSLKFKGNLLSYIFIISSVHISK